MSSSLIGYTTAVASAIFNGSFVAFSKLPSVQKVNVDPLLFQFYTCIGVFLSSLLTIPFIDQAVIPNATVFGYGVFAGGLFVFAVLFSFVAVPFVGLSIAQGVWGGTAVLVSFLWGVIAFHDEVNVGMGVGGVVLIVLGVVGIGQSDQIASRCLGEKALDENSLLMHDQYQFMEQQPVNSTSSSSSPTYKKFYGIIFSICVGLFGGSILVPMKLIPSEHQGLVFVPSFAIGNLIFAVAVILIYHLYLYIKSYPFPALHLRVCLFPGIAAGTVWNGANICSIYAVDKIGYSVAYPLMQCAVLIAGLWGWLAFKEVQGKAVIAFWISSAILLAGAAVLAISPQV